MAGLIHNAAASITPQAVEAKLHLPENMKAPFQRVVLAGLKVMFDPQTHQLMLKELAGPAPLPQKLGLGITGLIALLFQQAQRGIPPQLLIPAGLVLLAHAVQFVQQSGERVSAQEFGQASQIFIDRLLTEFKVDPARVAAAGARGQAQAAAGGKPAPAGGARD